MPAATYNPDPTTSTEKDTVRMLSGDRDMTRPVLTDDEIMQLLTLEQNAWLAAARACEIISTRNQGVVTKEVADLKLQWSDTAENAYGRYIKHLRERGARETLSLTNKSTVFRVLG